ncbi:hypothetical protein LZQ00_06475 [Sphingobacterium sp. SRCM116780]|uniref:hypothetical protein n=1 Tax=Sphingobacterium sp. SRCM116780 TaxID=2907623 RepID=UPI001F274223|nr:hypothetical protein [Sphingobacterium sp. SRCM116780]UIR57459.1 hypothetical protein LZQ00_06475 [Sphingobacterium sp. SRCM116780]
MKRLKTATCLLVDQNGKLFRKKCPFQVKWKRHDLNTSILIVKRIIIDDDNIILYDIEGEIKPHVDYDIVSECKFVYRIRNFVLLCQN